MALCQGSKEHGWVLLGTADLSWGGYENALCSHGQHLPQSERQAHCTRQLGWYALEPLAIRQLELGCVSKPCAISLNGSTGKEGHGAASAKAGVAESSRKCWVHVKTDSLLGGGVGR